MNTPPNESKKLNATERAELAETFIDMILDPANAWMREALLIGLTLPKDYMELLGEKTGLKERPCDLHFDKKFLNALEKMDKQELIALMKAEFEQKPPTKQSAEALLKLFDQGLWKRGIQDFERQFKGRPGRRLKIPRRDYPKLVEWAEALFPVLLKLLSLIRLGSNLPLRDHLKALQDEHPRACRFLLHHISKLESALKNGSLRNRATGLESQAQLLADALAGADYKLSLRTSMERTREGRRLMRRPTL